VRLVWVTGISGAGKSTVCEALKSIGIAAIDTDGDGFNQWVDDVTGEPVVDPPHPTPADWLDTHAWHIRPELVRALRNSRPGVTFLFGAVANEREVWDLFDRVGCVVVDDETVRHRLATRTNNAFGKNPADLDRILQWNREQEPAYRRAGATIIDGTRPVDEVVDAVLHLGNGLHD
jgi:energy-coupling factor transporter ATP-binding protein EcfA2